MVKVLLEMVLREVSLAETLVGAEEWEAASESSGAGRCDDQLRGCASESLHHLTQALSQVTNIRTTLHDAAERRRDSCDPGMRSNAA